MEDPELLRHIVAILNKEPVAISNHRRNSRSSQASLSRERMRLRLVGIIAAIMGILVATQVALTGGNKARLWKPINSVCASDCREKPLLA
jgi:hypothetical protein